MSNSKNKYDLVVTGFGEVHSSELNTDGHFSLESFQVLPHLEDKKVMKSVSRRDGYGLVALTRCKNDTKKAGTTWNYDSNKIGLFVGAPTSSSKDNESYMGSVLETKDANGNYQDGNFGKTYASSKPTTLLVGLPNNVLCHGAILLDAKGPNSNYTSTSISSHLAVMYGAEDIQNDKLDTCFVGGYSAHLEPIVMNMFAQNNIVKKSRDAKEGIQVGEGACFISLERKEDAIKRGAPIIANYLGGAMGNCPWFHLEEREATGQVMTHTIERALAKANIAKEDIGLLFLHDSGDQVARQEEWLGVKNVFANLSQKPALATLNHEQGDLIEAGGMNDIGSIGLFYQKEKVDEKYLPSEAQKDSVKFSQKVDQNKPYVLILRSDFLGGLSCLVFKK